MTTERLWVVLRNKPGSKPPKFIQAGPFTTAEVRSRLLEGTAQYTDFIWTDGQPTWLRISDIPEFGQKQSAPASPVAEPVDDATAVVAAPMGEVPPEDQDPVRVVTVDEVKLAREAPPTGVEGPDLTRGAPEESPARPPRARLTTEVMIVAVETPAPEERHVDTAPGPAPVAAAGPARFVADPPTTLVDEIVARRDESRLSSLIDILLAALNWPSFFFASLPFTRGLWRALLLAIWLGCGGGLVYAVFNLRPTIAPPASIANPAAVSPANPQTTAVVAPPTGPAIPASAPRAATPAVAPQAPPAPPLRREPSFVRAKFVQQGGKAKIIIDTDASPEHFDATVVVDGASAETLGDRGAYARFRVRLRSSREQDLSRWPDGTYTVTVKVHEKDTRLRVTRGDVRSTAFREALARKTKNVAGERHAEKVDFIARARRLESLHSELIKSYDAGFDQPAMWARRLLDWSRQIDKTSSVRARAETAKTPGALHYPRAWTELDSLRRGILDLSRELDRSVKLRRPLQKYPDDPRVRELIESVDRPS